MKQYSFKITFGRFTRFSNSQKEAGRIAKQFSGQIWEHNPFKKDGNQDENGVWHLL